MVAVLAVLAFNLTGWPHGGFVGIDVFFVVAGFLVTESLLRAAADSGPPSLSTFFLARVRRIVPAATVVLALTVAVSAVVLPSRLGSISVDALYSFFFLGNWRFAASGTAHTAATDTASPLLHFWPLSIEEQFFVVWPLLIVAVAAIAIRSSWSDARRRIVIGAAAGTVVVASLAWALYETAASPGWARFGTFARIWELGIGALLATATLTLARIPDVARPILSWLGLALIGASLVFIDGSAGFPAPWALLPVAGTALVIAAGIGREPDLQPFLRNRVSTYLGDISYSLYLVHWPVFVLLAATKEPTLYYYASALTLTFGLALLLYHFVESPLRDASWGRFQQARQDMKHGLHQVELSTKVGVVGGLILITVSIISFAMSPGAIT
ncbi:acyltransferase [Mycobacterium sp. 236(2023)]|nr:acyltransferase [Mycobacterium sp. 236(2023)]MDG4664219.1 acyltransferase [Mycobacterium sp. 236(2023)]